MLTDKDKSLLIKKPNDVLATFAARAYIESMPESVLEFYESNVDLINGEVQIIRCDRDEGWAANRRNAADKILFVFGVDYWDSAKYFTSCSEKIDFPKALRVRAVRH